MIDPVTVQRIKDTADIVDVVGDYVHLVRRGSNYMGLCPFHNERTPSFSVNKSRNYCYCFSCHKGGSPVNFIMEKEGISYHEALLQLAKKYGIEVRERELTNEEREHQTRREGMFVANEWAKNYFISNLEKEEGRNVGLTYLYGRHVTSEAIKAFGLGYAIDRGTDFTDEALRKGFSLDILKSVGLTGTSQQGHNYDKFRGRVIFPIINTAGKTVGFGGRDLKGSPAKYINSPESEIYVKNRELYGIFQAKGDMVRENKCFLVEGYLDVIGMWQSGVKNVVASSGTALTDGQIALIHRFTDNVTLIYDGDSAGIKASLRGIDMLLSHNLNVRAVALPEGEDPDSLSVKLTPEELKKYLKENEVDIIRFKINVLLDETVNDPQQKWKVVRSMVESIAHIADKIKRDIYIQEVSNLLDINETTLSSEIKKARFAIVEQERNRKRSEEFQRENKENQKDYLFSAQRNNSDLNFIETKKNNILEIKTDNLSSNQEDFFLGDVTIPPQKRHTIGATGWSNLFPMEQDLIYNCLKYGFVGLWETDIKAEDEDMLTVVEIISEELEIDGITFSHPEYALIFERLKSLLPKFKEDLKDYDTFVDESVKTKWEEGYQIIRQKNLSSTELDREEKNLESRLNEYAKDLRDDFAKNYILNQFGSDENDIIRNHTNQAMAEKHQLSSIFTKNKGQEKKEDKIFQIIITSLNVLKNGIIDEQLKTLMEELKNLGKDDEEKEREIHSKIGDILKMRSRMAKNIGDRILCPTSLKSPKTRHN